MKTLTYALLLVIGLFITTTPANIRAETKKNEIRTVQLKLENTVVFNQMIDPISVDTFFAAAWGKRTALNPDETLYILIVSGGGQYESALMMSEILELVPNTAFICGFCESGAGLVFAKSKLKRLVIEKSQMLMHELYQNHVTASQLNDGETIKSIKYLSNEFNQVFYSLIGIKREEFEAKILNREWIVDGQEMVKLHLADEVIKIKCIGFVNTIAAAVCY